MNAGSSMDASQDWIEALGALRAQGRHCALVVVTATKGSAPRESGARMLVEEGRLAWGTIGGGNLEKLAIEHASALLARGGTISESVEFPLAEATGQCCGGAVTLFFETFTWQRRTIAIFGAGHVGQALGALAPWLKARVLVIDGREEAAIQPRLPRERAFELLCVDAPEAELDTLPADALVLVMTHSHALDLEIIDRALAKRDFPYLGLIGSQRKWSRFQKRLVQRGHSSERLTRVKCPIGVSKTSKDPAAIALSAAAELVEVMERSRA